MNLLSTNTGKSDIDAAKAALEALLRDDKGLSQIDVKSLKTKGAAVYAAKTLKPFGYTAKACGACTDEKYAGDYDSFFRILRSRGVLPAACLGAQVMAVCSAPEVPRERTWNDAAPRRHAAHMHGNINLRILMVSLFQIMPLVRPSPSRASHAAGRREKVCNKRDPQCKFPACQKPVNAPQPPAFPWAAFPPAGWQCACRLAI